MKKILSLFLALIILFTVSCGDKTVKKGSENEQLPSENTEAQITELSRIEIDTDDLKRQAVSALNALPDTDISADEITIASSSAMEYVPNADSSSYANAVLERNSMFKKKYGAELIQFTELTDDVMIDNAENHLLAGLKYTDLFSIPAKSVHLYAEKGLLLNVNSLPGANYSADYFDLARMNSTANGYTNYAIYGDFNKDIDNYYCVYINHSLFEKNGLTLPYLSVEEGSWTWDSMLELSRNAAAADPTLSCVTAKDFAELSNTAFKSCGYDYFTTGYGITAAPSFASDSSQRLLETLRGLFSVYTDPVGTASESFALGTTLFCIDRVGNMDNVKTVGGDWGMLPLPKQDGGESSYRSYLSADQAVICIYAGANTEDLFAAIEGLYAASSGEYMTEAFYNDIIISSLPNSNSLNMLDYILGRKNCVTVSDFTDIYGSQYPELLTYTRDAIANAAKENTVHIFAAEDAAIEALDPILKEIE